MTELLVPESPVLHDTFPSPEMRGEATFGRGQRHDSLAPVLPAILPELTPEILHDRLEEARVSPDTSSHVRVSLILRHALKWSIRHADQDVLRYLSSLQSDLAALLDTEVALLEDEDGWGVVGMAIEATCGRQDKEEIVRMIVGRWGLYAGPRAGKDKIGWSPLHLAALISSPPLVSFLLTRGASADAQTNRGLIPLDLIADMEGREDVFTLLLGSWADAQESRLNDLASVDLSDGRKVILQKRRDQVKAKALEQQANEKEDMIRLQRERWIASIVRPIEVDVSLLFDSPKKHQGSRSAPQSWNDLGPVSEDEEEEDEGLEATDILNTYNNMLVYSPHRLETILDIFVTSYRPCSQPTSSRALPANALFLYARFALYRCDELWLEELIEGAVEKIEQEVYANVEDLAFLSFWMYNSTLLLHLLLAEGMMANTCEELGLLDMLEELINAIHVFIIRIAERRIDDIMDPALLDYEALETFDDVRFEGEWGLFRSFGNKKNRASVLGKKASQVFSGVSTSNSGQSSESSSPGLFNSLREKMETGSPFKVPATPTRHTAHNGLQSRTSESQSTPASLRGTSKGTSPKSVTDILSAVLVVLQLYEVNPAITVQAFSQIFFWIACEVFNRILARKKYLCRSKAVQIRMNITALDDWVRLNGLPVQTASKHFEPLNELLQWLQCQSALSDFDDLVSTMQNMKSINPLQMRRAVKDYRYEVNEGRMTDECGQYLAQLQKDWERRRVQASVHAIKQDAKQRDSGLDADSSFDSTTSLDGEPDEGTPIDALFDGTTALADFVPPSAPDAMGELLDSRYMLPFNLPSETDFLVAKPAADAAYANMNPGRSAGAEIGGPSSRPPSRSSFSASKPMGWDLPSNRKIRQLPADFFPWLRAAEGKTWLNKPVVDAKRVGLVQPPDDSMRRPSILRQRLSERSLKGGRRSTIETETSSLATASSQVDGFEADDEDATPVDHRPSATHSRERAWLPKEVDLSDDDDDALHTQLATHSQRDAFFPPPSSSLSYARPLTPARSLPPSPTSPGRQQSHHQPGRPLPSSRQSSSASFVTSPTTPRPSSPRPPSLSTADEEKSRWWTIGGRAGSADSTSDVSDIVR